MRITHPITGGTGEVTPEAFDAAWSDLGWVVADPAEPPTPAVPLEPLDDEDQIPAAELAGQQPPPGNAKADRMLRYLAAAGIPHDKDASYAQLRELIKSVSNTSD